MDVEHLLELVVTHLLNHAVERVAGVRDDDVETVEGLDRGVDEAVAEIGVGAVADAGAGIAAERLARGYHLGRRPPVATVYDDARARARPLEPRRGPDAAPPSPNKGQRANPRGRETVAST